MALTLNGTTGIAGANGSASTPAVQGEDTNTGVFFPAADTVAVATGGSERMRVDSSGNVGIGRSSPNSKQQVNTGTNLGGVLIGFSGGSSNFYDADLSVFRSGNGTERARIDSSGNLLVGLTSSTYKFAVKGADAALTSDGLSSNSTFTVQAHNGAGYNAQLYLECPGSFGGGMFAAEVFLRLGCGAVIRPQA